MKKRLLFVLLSFVMWMAGSSVTAVAQSSGQNNVMEIATAEDFHSFAELIEDGMQLDGLLTADIDLSTSDYPDQMVGSASGPFTGTFDGQGHTITYHYEGITEQWKGLFAYIEGATIRNLIVEGSAVSTNIHYGALIGVAYGTVLVENVVTNVDVTGERSSVTGDAGMLGANYANITFNNCAVLGPLGYPGSSMYSPFSGWSKGDSHTTLNNCYAACYFKEGTKIDGNSATLTHGGGPNEFNNCYYLNFIDKVQGTQVTEEQIANGSLCYKLNGDQSNIVWTQTIGVDAYPMPNPAGKRVYATGTCRCDGAEMEDNPLTYTNTESYPVIPDHQFGMDGTCTVCGTPDPNAVKQNEEGYYLIGNAAQLKWLALKIEQGDVTAKVLLTDDIDLTIEDEYLDLMLASEARRFQGIFDGGGHTITYDYGYVQEKWRGFFRSVGDGAVIRNLRIEGEVIPTNIHYGALIGVAYGTVLVENVVTNVNITGERSGVTGDAGMLGANYADITFNNCAVLGEMGNPGSSMYSPFSGWSNGESKTTLNNCYSTSQLTEGTGTGNCFTLTHQSGTVTINNSYYLHVLGKVLTGERIHQSQITEEQIESGELCYLLNGDQSDIHWYQTLGEDELPVPDCTHEKVYGAGQTFMNIMDESDFQQFVSIVIDEERTRYEETIAQDSLILAYLHDVKALAASANIDEFMAGYAALAGVRQSIQSCAEAYAAYLAKVDEALNYLDSNPDLQNEKVDQLRSYLTENNKPSADYPNGSVAYIIENLELSEEEIIAETARIEAKLTEAISYKPAIGTDVSVLFTNIDLSDKFNGWEGEVPTGWGGSETSPLYAAECLGKTMDMYQTVTGLENGIYELQVNGAFRPTPYNNWYNTNYAATLYANGVHNYFQANIEDMISFEDAIDGENCNLSGNIADFPITDDNDNIIGYTMQGIVSCCNAFQAGRYPNSVLCKVTDGTLTIGIRQPGTGQSRDWLGFGNIKVFYYGQLDEAAESLDRVLASQSARATTILKVYEPDYYDDYALYPNFSQALKNELQQTLDAVATTTESEAKYQLIEKFSNLFLQIYECKQAYIGLMDKAEELNALLMAFRAILTEDEFYRLEDIYSLLTNGYADGSLSTEEALAIDINDEITFLPEKEDDYYFIRTPKDLYVYAGLISAGYPDSNAKLLADIDLSESDYPDLMIGTEDKPFSYIFDGQGHKVTYRYENVEKKWRGLFAFVKDATIRNLLVEGSVYVTNIHYGALIGRGDGTILVENVVTNVDITGAMNQVTGDAGMIGANYAHLTFNNCATLGEMGYAGSSMYSSFSGWSDADSYTILNNCFTTCKLKEGTGTGNCFTMTHNNGHVTITNSYYLNIIGSVQGKKMTEEKFRNGEVCYKLNGDQTDIHWYQTIGEDALPVLDPSHQIVILEDGQYANPDAIAEIPADNRLQTTGIYDLSGRKVVMSTGKLQKGIYIVNGKKVLY